MSDHELVAVHIDGPGIRGDRAGDLVDVTEAGQAATQVEELDDALLGEVPYGALNEGIVLTKLRGDRGDGSAEALSCGPIQRKVGLSAKQAVMD
ncbi:hypothetical protein GCM10010156_52920 [Planobispora rosea]|uniref:Uncharacterized protein n=1 Tax=Planobispora rosea TaxID=35762 RepID=A0A8J3S822_PLARO|nr:hypothetical protein GCM10010156_52920 [Planobispora rosea]GIH86694.1 hypothetical protein Pro02_51020 [Planobispora rosea]